MTYLKVAWKHNFEDEPAEMLSELDDRRMETRKVERFSKGALNFAGQDEASGDTHLSETAIPLPDAIRQDPQFQPVVIEQDEFEQVWRAARITVAA